MCPQLQSVESWGKIGHSLMTIFSFAFGKTFYMLFEFFMKGVEVFRLIYLNLR